MELMISLHRYEQKYKFKYLCLYHGIKDLILNGVIIEGEQLPSSRDLAIQYHVSRATINQVYEMLIADGYITTKIGSGTYVSYFFTKPEKNSHKQNQIYLSNFGKKLPQLQERIDLESHPYDFSKTYNGNYIFPSERWKKAVKFALRDMDYLIAFDEPNIQGIASLREAISVYLNRTRGMKVEPEDICIVNGSIHAIGILSQLLIDKGDKVLIQNPTYPRIKRLVEMHGGIPIAIEDNHLNQLDSNCKLCFVTPNHQYPIGRTMKLEKRMELLNWAKKYQAFIIEDDIYSDFSRWDKPLEPIKSLDFEDRVIYLGTFFGTILPSLRIGYVVLPKQLKEYFLRAKHVFEPFTTSVFEQFAIANFLKSGVYDSHIRKLRRIITKKQRFMKEQFDIMMPQAYDWITADSGLDMFGWWNHTADQLQTLESLCLIEGVKWVNPKDSFLDTARPSSLFDYSFLTESEIKEGIKKIANIYKTIV